MSARHSYMKMDKYRPDYTTPEGAEALKAKIEDALKKRGLRLPQIEIVRGGTIHRQSMGLQPRYDIRSNMVDGLPKGARQ